jgi:hypothetical protein
MGRPVRRREDYTAAQVRGLARRSHDAGQTRRLLALAAIYEGGSRGEAAKIGGVGLQTVRDGVLAFNAAGPHGLINGKDRARCRCLMPISARPWRGLSRMGRSQRRTVWCAGA